MEKYLKSTEFLNFDNKEVREYATRNTSKTANDVENAVSLYYAVRDDFHYNPYKLDLRREGLQASDLLTRNHGYCVEKAVLLAATWRAINIPSRLSFYIVKNHIATERIEQILGTNKLVFHGAAEVYLNGEWLKTTPAFNKKLCDKLNVAPLDFDGKSDSIFQQYDANGNVFMDYLYEYGDFDDLPYQLYLDELKKYYPHILQSNKFTETENVYDLTK